ncbi:MAG: aminotransferase class V-fold PLP-dependent enzyme, partial [Planctomycetota bacterium]
YFPEIETREQIASIINCSTEELSLTQNSHMAMNKISMGLDLQPGDEIVQTDQEHPGGECGWLVCEKRHGIVHKKVKIPIPPNDPGEIIQRFEDAMTPKTKVLAIPHITSTLGLIMPVKEIVQMYRAKGIFTILDGAQAVGQVKVDVKDIDCDAYFTSLHKWLLAPAGNGCLFVKRGSAERIWTVLAGKQWDNREDPGFRLQEHGLCSRPLLLGLSAAAEFFQDVGPDRWIGRVKEMGDRLRTGLQAIPGVKIYSSVHPAMSAGMTTYKVDGWDGIKMYDHFLAKKAMRMRKAPNSGTRAGAYGVRQSVHIYNTEAEINRALEAVQEIASLGEK